MASAEIDKNFETEEEEVSVSPSDLIKHPLEHTWALWFFKNDKRVRWDENLHLVTSVSFVEDFWSLYHHIIKPSRLPHGCDYSLFKDGIEPMWEDHQNKMGGRWLVNMDNSQSVDNVWQEMLLCLIGEAFDEQSHDVCGAVVNIRHKGSKIALWTRDCNRQHSILRIGETLKARLTIPREIIMGYQAHSDAMTSRKSAARNRYEL